MARVPLMPISQSASLRQRAASASGNISSSLRRLAKPSRIAPGVIDCSHRRCTGCLALVYCAIRRKINSPSRPASQALIRPVTSLRLISRDSALRRDSVLAIGLSAKCGGIIGRWVKVHLPRLTSYSSGTAISSKWPTAEDSTYSSDSKYSSCLVKPPSVFAISFATEGFSAMMRVLLINMISKEDAITGTPHTKTVHGRGNSDCVKAISAYIVANIWISRGNDKRVAEQTASLSAWLWLTEYAPEWAYS